MYVNHAWRTNLNSTWYVICFRYSLKFSFVLVLLKLGFDLYFHENSVNLLLEISFYGNGYLLDGFIALDIDYNTSNVFYFVIYIFY